MWTATDVRRVNHLAANDCLSACCLPLPARAERSMSDLQKGLKAAKEATALLEAQVGAALLPLCVALPPPPPSLSRPGGACSPHPPPTLPTRRPSTPHLTYPLQAAAAAKAKLASDGELRQAHNDLAALQAEATGMKAEVAAAQARAKDSRDDARAASQQLATSEAKVCRGCAQQGVGCGC